MCLHVLPVLLLLLPLLSDCYETVKRLFHETTFPVLMLLSLSLLLNRCLRRVSMVSMTEGCQFVATAFTAVAASTVEC